jgi:hypothetical protein
MFFPCEWKKSTVALRTSKLDADISPNITKTEVSLHATENIFPIYISLIHFLYILENSLFMRAIRKIRFHLPGCSHQANNKNVRD